MSAEIKNERGTISISNTVIANLAGYTATQCYGVVGMCAKTGKDGIASLLKKENMDKGIKVRTEGGTIEIALFTQSGLFEPLLFALYLLYSADCMYNFIIHLLLKFIYIHYVWSVF